MLVPRWIISPSRLYEESQSISKKGAEVMFIVNTKEKAEKLIKNGLNFGLARKSVAYFQEVDFKAICYKCCGIGHDKPGTYKDRLLMCIIYEKDHNTNNYKCNIIIYKA